MFLTWLGENIWTILICAALGAAVIAIIVSLVRKRKRGASSCGCACASCPMSASCHKH